MKIALIIFHADPARGGAERYTVDLAGALVERGHEVAVLASGFAGDIPGVECVKLRSRGITRLGKYLKFLDSLDEHLATTGYDVSHAMLPVRRCDIYHPHAGLAADAVASGHKKHPGLFRRLLSRLSNLINIKRNWFAHIERDLLTGPRPPIVISLSRYIQETVTRHYPALVGDRLATLFNAVDLGSFDPDARPQIRGEMREKFGIPQDATVGLIIAQDFVRKGLRETMRGLEAAGRKDLWLVVVGKQRTGPYRRLAQTLACGPRIVFAGKTRDPQSFYAAADFFVLPTHHDPCSLVVLEALAMGLPVISTRQNGACEIMTHGIHGYVLDAGDRHEQIEALAESMVMLCDPARRTPMHRACLELRQSLTYRRHVENLVELYERVYSQATRD